MSRLSRGLTGWSLTLDDHVSVVAVGPDGASVLVGSLAGEAIVADVATGTQRASLPAHARGLLTGAWSPDGTRVATGGQDGIVRVCDHRGATIGEHSLGAWVEHLAWSSAGILAATAGRALVLVTPDGGLHRFADVSSTITAVVWSTNGTRVGVASYGGVTWYDVDRLPSVTPARRHDFKGSPLALALSPTGKWACAGYQDASIHVWPLWSGDDLAMSGYPAKVEHLAFRADGRWLASACVGELTWWDFDGKGPKGRAPAVGSTHRARVTWLGWQPNGTLLASGDKSGQILVWPSPTSTRRPVDPASTIQTDASVGAASWTADGHTLIVGGHDGTVSSHPLP